MDRTRSQLGLAEPLRDLEVAETESDLSPALPREGAPRQPLGMRAPRSLRWLPVGNPSPDHRLPFCVRLTTNQILAVADDADLRAQMLEWSTVEMPSSGSDLLRRMRRLHEAATVLRSIAEELAHGWTEPKGAS